MVCEMFSCGIMKRPVYQQSESMRPEDYFYNPDLHDGLIRQYLLFTAYSRRLVQNESFNIFIIIVICIAGVNVGIQSYDQMQDVAALDILDNIILIIFSFEVIVKILSEGLAPQLYFLGAEWKWNNFDFTIVFMSLPFWGGLFGGGSLALLRLVRLMRLAKLIRKIPALQVIVKGLTGGMASIGYIMILLGLVFYLFAVAGFYLFSKNDPFHFGTLPISVMTMFRCSTLDAWSDVMYLNMFGCDGYDYLYVLPEDDPDHQAKLFWCEAPKKQFVLSAIYFVIFTIISALVMLSLFIGAVTLSMNDSLSELKRFAEDKKKEKRFEKNVNKLLSNAQMMGNKSGASRRGKFSQANSAANSAKGSKLIESPPKKSQKARNKLDRDMPSDDESCVSSGSNKKEKEGLPSSSRSSSPVKEIAPKAYAKIHPVTDSDRATTPPPSFPPRGGTPISPSHDDDSVSVSTYDNSVITSGAKQPLNEEEKRRRSIENLSKDDQEHLNQMMQYLEQRRNSVEHESEEEQEAPPIFALSSVLPEPMALYLERVREEKILLEKEELTRRLKIGLGQLPHGIEDEPKSLSLFFTRMKDASSIKERWLIISEHCKVIAESSRFVNFVTLVICMAGVNVGAQTDPRITGIPVANYTLNILDIFILSVFTLEVVVKLFAEGLQPWAYFKDGWNKFDFIIVVGSYIPGAGSLLTILRLLRLLRVLKLVKSLPQLAVIVNALLMGMSSIGYIGLILFMCFYVFAILGMMMFKGNDPFHFGNLHIAMFTLFRCSTLDDWTEVMYNNVYGCDKYPGVYEDFPEMCDNPKATGLLAALYFNVFIMVGAQVLLTLFIGVVTTSMEQAQDIQDAEMKLERQLKALTNSLELTPVQVKCFRQVFSSLDADNYGTIEGEQLATCFDCIDDLLGDIDIDEEVTKADPGNRGIDLITFIVVLCNIPTCRHQRVLRRAVRRWQTNKRKKGLFFFKRSEKKEEKKETSPRPAIFNTFVSGLGDMLHLTTHASSEERTGVASNDPETAIAIVRQLSEESGGRRFTL